MIEPECFYCDRPVPPPSFWNGRILKSLLRKWRQACGELTEARRHRLASERRADLRVAQIERDIVRHCWATVFNDGKSLRGMPRTARPKIARRKT